MNARGAMEIIIATIGLQLGILSPDMFSIIVVMAIATSLMAPPALRWVLAHVQAEEQELERLRREELAATSFATRLTLSPWMRTFAPPSDGEVFCTLNPDVSLSIIAMSPGVISSFSSTSSRASTSTRTG